MKKVLINIKGTQSYGEDTDTSSLITEGEMEIKDGNCRLIYNENDMIGAQNVTTELLLEGNDKFSITRKGGLNSILTVEKGKRHSCLYDSPQGAFVIGIFGEEIFSTMNESGGEIHASYTIDVNSGLLSSNKMDIKVEEIK